jgi:hypothetical protein
VLRIWPAADRLGSGDAAGEFTRPQGDSRLSSAGGGSASVSGPLLHAQGAARRMRRRGSRAGQWSALTTCALPARHRLSPGARQGSSVGVKAALTSNGRGAMAAMGGTFITWIPGRQPGKAPGQSAVKTP